MDEQILAQLEELAEKNGCSRRQLVLDAIGHFLNYKEPDPSEVDQLKSKLNQAVSERDLARSECDKKSYEIKNLDLEISQRNDDLANTRSEVLSIKEKNELLQKELQHSQDVIKQKNEEIAFLRSHTHQLSEKIISALQLGKDEEKAKRWWNFW